MQKGMTSKENIKHVGDNFNSILCLKHVRNEYKQQCWNKRGRKVMARILHCPRKGKMYQLDLNKSKMHAAILRQLFSVWFIDNWESPKPFQKIC